jgi:hypothetical protein
MNIPAKESGTPLLRCGRCGWVHIGVPAPEPAGDCCFRCGAWGFEVIGADEARRTVPQGVTLQGIRWPPVVRPPPIPRDRLTAADIEPHRSVPPPGDGAE